LPGDLPHDRAAGLSSLNGGAMDGFALGEFGPLYAYSQFREEDVPNYWHWAREYVLGDHVFASVLGPSHPNHLHFIAGADGGAIDNPEGIKVRRENGYLYKSWGIDAVGDEVFVFVEDQHGNLTKHGTRSDLPTVGEQLSARDIDWAYYAAEPHQAGYIWSTYSAIPNVFETELWDRHVRPVDRLLADIEAAALPAVSWVTPRFELSDHPPFSTYFAHDWVTAIVNGIMRSPMWDETAIFLTWDEWGGLYDHVRPPVVGGRELGFRVPMLVVSPYARRGYVDETVGDFSGPLRFIADNWDLPYLTPAIRRSHTYEHVFDWRRGPRPPDPRRPRGATGSGPRDFPRAFPAWPRGTEPNRPDFLSAR
ncbi:MAG TPA: alkaline phosphatase family protein, partial [Actinomycetota bacterium]|nr:alkaline phosphatase family protein [Actinomycetota bacterium]